MSKEDSAHKELLAKLPKVDRVLAEPALAAWTGTIQATQAVRDELELLRSEIRGGEGEPLGAGELAERASEGLQKRFRPRLRRVLNGTGIVVHTNLGRSPLSEAAISAMEQAARGYSSLEFELASGKRGSRHSLVTELLTSLTGAEDALVTNNNAAALMLALSALASRKRVLVSRGQLVEIGGSFRIPDICRAAGAKLAEVGTTNRTRLSDYEAEIDKRAGLLLRVHPSNYQVVGFTEEANLEQLVELGARSGLPVVDDLGSGALLDLAAHTELPRESTVAEAVATGADVVCFSGDKLLGGPQAGIAVGKQEAISRMRRHPLMRAVRPDKLSFAALDATLRAYLHPEQALELPIWKMLRASAGELRPRGKQLLKAWIEDAASAGFGLELVDSVARSGGGSLPGEELPSLALRFSGSGRRLSALARALRLATPPVIGYLKEDAFHLDLRTLLHEATEELQSTVAQTLRELAR